MIPHLEHAMRGPNHGTGVLSGHRCLGGVFEKRQNSERPAATDCNYSRLHLRAANAMIWGKGGPDLAGWGARG
jgi:hypothetical protein